MKQPDTNLAKAIRELQNEVDQKTTLLEALRKEYDPEDIDFYQYIKTQAWEEMRQKVFRRDGFQCVVCKEAKNLNVHHITYDNLGAEKESDLVTLCRVCHEKVHAGDTVQEMVGNRQYALWKAQQKLNTEMAEFQQKAKQFEIDKFMNRDVRRLYAYAIALGEDYINLKDELKIEPLLIPEASNIYGFTKHMNEGKPIEDYKWFPEPPFDICSLPNNLSDYERENKEHLMFAYLRLLGELSLKEARHFLDLELRHGEVQRQKTRFELMSKLAYEHYSLEEL